MSISEPRLGTEFHQWLGLSFEFIGTERVTVVLAMRDDLRGPAGSLEGGIVATLVDVAGATAGARYLGPLVATQSISMSFLAPGKVGPIAATGTVLRAGKTDAVVDVKVIDRGREDRLMSAALLTLRRLEPRPSA